MHIKPDFVLRQIGDGYVVVALGKAADGFRGIIRLNETGAFLFKTIQEGGRSIEDLVSALEKEYRVDVAVAREDVSAFVNQLQEAGVIVA